ncbi:hypothetical protein WP5W18E06_P10510 (plasmid) [Klebsiella quasipneumoniae]|uniref:YagB n=1 Tax=Escherichia coli TaxID=562 RepID=A0A7T3V7J8_ECOLX|nr:YagB [Escherichia coli]BBS24618.1 hypothetical protein WP5W18E06_P10510 [Klebsiella quasipneumoniae]SCA39456.1 Uncharacterised protein [Klebsiella quasipneumoniae]
MYDCGHYLPEPFPDELADEFRMFFLLNRHGFNRHLRVI